MGVVGVLDEQEDSLTAPYVFILPLEPPPPPPPPPPLPPQILDLPAEVPFSWLPLIHALSLTAWAAGIGALQALPAGMAGIMVGWSNCCWDDRAAIGGRSEMRGNRRITRV